MDRLEPDSPILGFELLVVGKIWTWAGRDPRRRDPLPGWWHSLTCTPGPMFDLWRDRAARHERKCRDAYDAVQREKKTYMEAEEAGVSYEAYLERQTARLFGPGRTRTVRGVRTNTGWFVKQKKRQAKLAQEYIDRYLDDDDAA